MRQAQATLRFGLPSKGRLMEQCCAWLETRGATLRRLGEARAYASAFEGLEGVEPVLLAPGEIPRALASGRLHLAITGRDLVREELADWAEAVFELAALGFGRADLVLAVPDAWVDVATLDDLDAVAAQFRAHHGFRLRIATKYHRLVRDYLRTAGVADYQLVDSQGATEAAVQNLLAEAIADITSTGETLRANHLRPLEGPPILASEAVLFLSRPADWSGRAALLGALCAQLKVVEPPLSLLTEG